MPENGDRIVVDTSISVVYLIHSDGTWTALEGLTGQRRTVSYDGITYYAATPERTWEVRSDAFEKKGRSVTFGEGRFLRLSWPDHRDYRRGDESTAYGIHSHLSFERMLQDKKEKTNMDRQGTGHRSMGCILVSEADLDLIEATWRLNGGFLQVSTMKNVDPIAFEPIMSFAKEPRLPSWLGWME